jgi:hypothetical protein
MIRRTIAIATLVALAASPTLARDIARRKVRQAARIDAGAATGRLSSQEASRLEHREAGLSKEESAMREANGGRLSMGERRVLTHQQNRLSRQIWRQKHDGNDR